MHNEVAAGQLCHDRRERHRHRDSGRESGTGVRSLLHHQGGRQGHRPWSEHGVRLRQAVERPYQDLQRGRPRHHGEDLPAARDRTADTPRAKRWRHPAIEGGDEIVLVVEDDALVRRYVITQIESLGYTTLEASQRDGSAGHHRQRRPHRSAVHRRHHARLDERPPTRRRGAEAAPGAQDAVHLGLYRERHRASRPARHRRAAARQAVSRSPIWRG